MNALRIVFMGSPDFSIPTLRALTDAGHEIICVYAQPPRPAGRGHKEKPCPVHAFAQQQGLTVRTPENFKDNADQTAFADLDSDLAVVVAYGLILPEAVLNAPRFGCINVHASLLPRWRGAAPIQRAIQAGDEKTGVCIMQMDKGLDTGPVYLSEEVDITPRTTGGMLHDTLCDVGGGACVQAIEGIVAGDLTATPQPADGVTYAEKLNPDEARIDWSRQAGEIERTVRAFDPWPGTWFEHNGERIKLLRASLGSGSVGLDSAPGTVIGDAPSVACGEGELVLERLQRAGRKPQDADEFLRGYALTPGIVLDQVRTP